MATESGMRKLKGEPQTRRRLWRYGPLVLWLAFIFFASSGQFSASNTSRIIGPLLQWIFPNISDEKLVLAHLITRKMAHFAEYAILAWLAARAFNTSSRTSGRVRWFWISLLIVILSSLLDEYHQSLVAARTGSIYDSFLDMFGGLTALFVYSLRHRRTKGTSN